MPSVRPQGTVLPALLAARAEQTPDRTALEVAGVGRLTFGRWSEWSGRVGTGLRERGIRPGDRVGLRFAERDWIDYAVAYCAVHRAGAVAVPVSDRLPAAEASYLFEDCAVTAVLHGPGLAGPGVSGWQAPLAEVDSATGPPEEPVRPEDPAQIVYTSGTTGRPKGVLATHANLAFGCRAQARHRPLGHSEHFLHAFPIGTNAGQTMLVNALDARPAALTLPHFTPRRFARLIETYRVGTVFLVPAMAIELLNAEVHRAHDLSSVVLLGSTAAALPPAVAAGLAAAFPAATIVNYYTSTEAAPAQTTMVVDPRRPASVGRPSAGAELRVAGPDGHPLATGQTGDVWLRSPTRSRGYYGERGPGEVFRDGWVRMGDLGYLDPDGYLYLVDRESDVIKSGAFKVSTTHVEAVLYEHPDVLDAAVLGVPHPVLGSAVGAAIVARNPLAATDLRAFLMTRLARHELPTHLVFVPALPRNHGGKVVKSAVREMLTAPAGA